MHGGHELLDAHAAAQTGRAEGARLATMPQPLARRLALGAGQGVQGLLDGAIAGGRTRAIAIRVDSPQSHGTADADAIAPSLNGGALRPQYGSRIARLSVFPATLRGNSSMMTTVWTLW